MASFLILNSPSSRHALQSILHLPRSAASVSQFSTSRPISIMSRLHVSLKRSFGRPTGHDLVRHKGGLLEFVHLTSVVHGPATSTCAVGVGWRSWEHQLSQVQCYWSLYPSSVWKGCGEDNACGTCVSAFPGPRRSSMLRFHRAECSRHKHGIPVVLVCVVSFLFSHTREESFVMVVAALPILFPSSASRDPFAEEEISTQKKNKQQLGRWYTVFMTPIIMCRILRNFLHQFLHPLKISIYWDNKIHYFWQYFRVCTKIRQVGFMKPPPLNKISCI